MKSRNISREHATWLQKNGVGDLCTLHSSSA